MTCIVCDDITIRKCAPYANKGDTLAAIKEVCKKSECSWAITNVQTILTIEAYLIATYPDTYPNDCCGISWAYNPDGDLFYKDLGGGDWIALTGVDNLYEIPNNNILITNIDSYLLATFPTEYPPVGNIAWAYTPSDRFFLYLRYPGDVTGTWQELTNQTMLVYGIELNNLEETEITDYLTVNVVPGNPPWPITPAMMTNRTLVFAHTLETPLIKKRIYMYDQFVWREITDRFAFTPFNTGTASDTFDASWQGGLPASGQREILFASINDGNVDYTDKNEQLYFKINGQSAWINLTTNIVNVNGDNVLVDSFNREFPTPNSPDSDWPKTNVEGAEESLRFFTKNGRAYARAVGMDSVGGVLSVPTWSRISPNEKMSTFFKLIANQPISTIDQKFVTLGSDIEQDEYEGHGIGSSERILSTKRDSYYTLIQGLDSNGKNASIIRFNRKGLYRFEGQVIIDGGVNGGSDLKIDLRIVRRPLLTPALTPVEVYAKQTHRHQYTTAFNTFMEDFIDTQAPSLYPSYNISTVFYHSDLDLTTFGYTMEIRIININNPATSANESVIGGYNAIDGYDVNYGAFFPSPSFMKVTLLAEDIDELV